jgi:hypothetical protein
MPSLDMLQRKEVLLPLSLNASHSYRWLRKSFSDVLLREPSDIRVDHLCPNLVADLNEKSSFLAPLTKQNGNAILCVALCRGKYKWSPISLRKPG